MKNAGSFWDAPETLLQAAEDELSQSRIDSARRYLSAIPEADLKRRGVDLEFLSRFFRALAIVNRDSNQIESAIGSYEQLELVAREMNQRSLINEAIIGKVMILTNNDRVPLARGVLRLHHQELSATASGAEQAEYAFWRARVLEDSGEIEGARTIVANEVIPLSRLHEDPGLQVARYALSSRLALIGETVKWKDAESTLSCAEDLVSSNTTLLRRGQFVQGIALFELYTGDIDSASRHADVAEEIFRAGGIVSHQLRRLRHRLAQVG
jgi:hypothetical protein